MIFHDDLVYCNDLIIPRYNIKGQHTSFDKDDL